MRARSGKKRREFVAKIGEIQVCDAVGKLNPRLLASSGIKIEKQLEGNKLDSRFHRFGVGCGFEFIAYVIAGVTGAIGPDAINHLAVVKGYCDQGLDSTVVLGPKVIAQTVATASHGSKSLF